VIHIVEWCYYSCSFGRRCFHHIEMISVVKLKKSFWSAAGYSNYVCIFLGICWCLVSVWYIVGQFVFFALVEIRFVNAYPEYLSCVSVFILRLLSSNNFLFVSVIPVGASDRLAELSNRTWWQE
jgi:hypothetical protein